MSASGFPQEHLALIVNLEEMEKVMLDKIPNLAPELVAQGLTCLAHDWIDIGLEEKGHQLLIKADQIYPGYHKDKMQEHMKADPDFDRLIRQMGQELIIIALSTMKDVR